MSTMHEKICTLLTALSGFGSDVRGSQFNRTISPDASVLAEAQAFLDETDGTLPPDVWYPFRDALHGAKQVREDPCEDNADYLYRAVARCASNACLLDKNGKLEARGWDDIRTDPFGGVPVGWRSSVHRYTVLGFSAPGGRKADRLMVKIKYDGGGETTLNYAHVLCHFVDSR